MVDGRQIHSLKVHNYHGISETPINYEYKILWYIHYLKVDNIYGGGDGQSNK